MESLPLTQLEGASSIPVGGEPAGMPKKKPVLAFRRIRHFASLSFLQTTPYLTDLLYWAVRKLEPLRQFGLNYKARRTMKGPVSEYKLGGMFTVTNNVCNARCIFCAYPKVKGTLKHGLMDMELYSQVVNYWKSQGGDYFEASPGLGDPFTDPLLRDRIKIGVERGLTLSVTTNGIGLIKHYDWLARSGLTTLYLSIPSLDDAVFKQIDGIDRGRETFEGMCKFLELNASLGEPVAVVIRFRNFESPRKILRHPRFQEIKKYLSPKVRVNFTLWWDNWGGAITELPKSMPIRKVSPVNHPCQSLQNMTVRWDGQIRLCGCRLKESDDDDMVVGNIKEGFEPAKERAKGIINGFFEGRRPEVCRDCRLYLPATHY